MKIAVFSDIHDQLENLEKALNYLTQNSIDTILFCGDFCSPFPVKKHLAKFDGKIHAVYGNTEDRFNITQFAEKEAKNIILYGEFAELEFEGRKVALTHYPTYAEAMVQTGKYDAVFCGHYHEHWVRRFGENLYVNPGEIAGFKEEAGFCVWDTESNGVERVLIKTVR